MLHNIKFIYLHCVFHGIRFKVNNEDWLSVRIAFFCFAILGILKSASNLNGNLNCSKELEHYAS